MSEERPNIDEIFNTAADLLEGDQREAYLREICQDDLALRREIEELLERDQAAGSFLETPPTGLDATVVTPVTESPGTQIGPYRLMERIGEGGMGVVYLAEQTQPVRRQVALKIIKPGMDTAQVIKRFEAERQALALMDHPNIARVFDAGATETGRPYFVMELVKGVPITEYCDQHQLSPRERLALFATVCHAVQHSHQKGIIHRDIKPSNVLVTTHDERPVIKVIDFGLAKAMGNQLLDQSLCTQQGQIVGTVEYMSPEQADLNPIDVDTRTDIYSLGVLLYELLAGEPPFDRNRLRSAAFNEILRIIREEEPPRPSVKLSSSEALPSIAANRHCEPRKLSTLVRGELDWIVMRALEKDRSRRYATANGLASDINRYLHDEQVTACPPSAMYRFKKFARRNKAVLATTTAILVCLLAGIAGTTWQAIRATKAENIAVQERDDKELARLEAEGNAGRARQAAESERLAKEAEAEQRRLALAASEQEKRQRREAERLQLVAEEKELLARRNLYAAHMNLAQQALEHGHTTRVHRLLQRHVPIPGEPDWRQFEWYYLLGECHREQWEIGTATLSNVAFAPNGREVAVGNRSNIEIHDLANRKRVQVLEGDPRQFIYALAFSPDGTQLVSGASHYQDEPSSCVVWDTKTWQRRRELAGIKYAVPVVRFSPDGKMIAVADGGHYDNKEIPSTIRLYDAETGEPIRELNGHIRMIRSLAFDPGGKRLASAQTGEADELRIWDVSTGEPLETGHIRGTCVDWSPDGSVLATAHPHAIWNANTGQLIRELTSDDSRSSVLGLSFSPDGKQLAFAMQRDNSVRVWDVNSGAPISVLKGHTNWVWSVAYSPNSQLLGSTARDGTVKFWDADFGDEHLLPGAQDPWQSQHAKGRNHVAISGDGEVLAAAQDFTRVAIFESLASAEPITLDAGATIRAIALSADGSRLAIGTKSHVQVWNVAEQTRIDQRSLNVKSLCFSSDDQKLFVVVERRVEVIETVGLATLEKLTLPGSPYVDMVCASPDGRHLAIIAPNFQGKVYLWDLTNRELRATFVVSRWTTNLAFSPDGRTLAASGGSWFDARSAGVTKLWDLATLREIGELKAHDGLHTGLAFAPDGNSLATSSDNAEITLWDLETLEERITFHWGSDPVDCLLFSPDGSSLISGNNHEAVKLWQPASPRIVRACEHSASLANVARYAQVGDWERVAIVCSRLMESEDQPHLRQLRAQARAELGRWDEAKEDMRTLLDLFPSDYRLAYEVALAQLAAGDEQGYQQTIAAMLARHKTTTFADAAEQIAWVTTLRSVDGAQGNEALRLGSLALSEEADFRLADVVIGAALYRLGRFQDAVDWLSECSSNSPINNQYSPLYTWFFLAMAHHHLGDDEASATWFDRARQGTEEETASKRRPLWNRRLTLALLEQETARTIEQPLQKASESSLSTGSEPQRNQVVEDRIRTVLARRRMHRFVAQKQWQEAAASILNSPTIASSDAGYLIQVGNALLKQDRVAQASEITLRAARVVSSDTTHWISLLQLARKVGDADVLKSFAQHAAASLADPSLDFTVADTHQLRELGLRIADSGFRDESVEILQATSASWGRLRKQKPRDARLATDHAHTLIMLADRWPGREEQRLYWSQAETHVQVALELIQRQETNKNLAAYTHATAGELHQRQGRFEESRRELEKSLALDPQDPWTHIRMVMLLEVIPDHGPATVKQIAEHAIAAFQLNSEHHAIRGRCRNAVAALQKAIARGEVTELDSIYLAAIGQTHLGRPGAALPFWELAEQRSGQMNAAEDSDDDNATKSRDEALSLLNRFVDAEGSVTLPELDPRKADMFQRDFEFWIDYASTWQQLGERDRVLPIYEQVLKAPVDESGALLARGNLCQELGQDEQAIIDFTEAIESADSSTTKFDALHARAIAYRRSGQPLLAARDFSQLIQLRPKDAWLYGLRAEVYLYANQPANAIADCDRSVELDPDNVHLLLIRAQVLMLADHAEDYRQACESFFDRFGQSEDPYVACHAARACVFAPHVVYDPGLPLEVAQASVSHFPTGLFPRMWMLYTLGLAHLRAGQLDQAEQAFLDSIQANPNWISSPNNWLGLGLVEQQRGNQQAARQWLRRAIDEPKTEFDSPQDRLDAILLRRELERSLDPLPPDQETETTATN